MQTDNAIESYKRHGFSEAYEVVGTYTLQRGGKSARLEVLRVVHDAPIAYTARCYVEEHVDGRRVWTVLDGVPWVAQDTPEAALGQAMGWLAERMPPEE